MCFLAFGPNELCKQISIYNVRLDKVEMSMLITFLPASIRKTMALPSPFLFDSEHHPAVAMGMESGLVFEPHGSYQLPAP